ncbi:MAG: hypothetical protein IKK29_06210 [Christensenellaceae bacterium]|nr:hypothetical protein [Christensenellaceae bacterium]
MSSKINNQHKRIAEYIRQHGSISEGESHLIKVGKLSARLTEMRRLGYPIKGTWVKGRNEYGPYRYMRYTLEDKEA